MILFCTIILFYLFIYLFIYDALTILWFSTQKEKIDTGTNLNMLVYIK